MGERATTSRTPSPETSKDTEAIRKGRSEPAVANQAPGTGLQRLAGPAIRLTPPATPFVQRTGGNRKRKTQDDGQQDQKRQQVPVPANFNQALRDMVIYIDEAVSPPVITRARNPDASPAKAKSHWNLPVEQRYVQDEYTIPFRTYDEDGSGSGGRAYRVVIPYAEVLAQQYNPRKLSIISFAEIPAEGNPFGRFETTNAFVLVTDANLSDNAIQTLKNKVGNTKVSRQRNDIPNGYHLDHTSAMGYEVWTQNGPTNLAMPGNAGNLAQQGNLTGVDNTGARNTGAMQGTATSLTLNRWRGRSRWPDQVTVMNMSPNDVASELGFAQGPSWEWLHLIAHRFGGGGGAGPQRSANLVLGTSAANTRMMEIEEGLSFILKRDDVRKVDFQVTPHLVDQNVNWLADRIDYQVTITKSNAAKTITESFNPLAESNPPLLGLEAARHFAKEV